MAGQAVKGGIIFTVTESFSTTTSSIIPKSTTESAGISGSFTSFKYSRTSSLLTTFTIESILSVLPFHIFFQPHYFIHFIQQVSKMRSVKTVSATERRWIFFFCRHLQSRSKNNRFNTFLPFALQNIFSFKDFFFRQNLFKGSL